MSKVDRSGRSGHEVLTALLDKLDAMESEEAKNRRKTTRCAFRKIEVPIRIHHPGGSTSVRAVATRNLSASGLGFLHGGFLYNGTRVEVILKRRLGGEDVLKGQVAFCGHVAGVLHQIGVKFDEKIFPKLYLDPGSYEEVELEAAADPNTIKGRILYLDDQEMDRMLMQHHLRDSKIELTAASSTKQTIDALGKQSYDLILLDMNLEDMPGEKVVAEIRSNGYTGPICMVTAETSQQRLKAAQQAGAVGVLQKPYEKQKLVSLISNWLGGGSSEQAIYSQLEDQPDMQGMLEKYVDSVQKAARDLMMAAEKDDFDRTRQIATSLKGSGSGYGFTLVSEAAKEAVKNLDATCSVAESAVQVQRLIDICKRVSLKTIAA